MKNIKFCAAEMILEGKVRPGEVSESFLATVGRYSGQAKERGELKTVPGTADTASR